jgi:F-box-like
MPGVPEVVEHEFEATRAAGTCVAIGETAIGEEAEVLLGDYYSTACVEPAVARRDLGKRPVHSFPHPMSIEGAEGAASITPIHRLPNELLVTLFELLVESQEFERRERLFQQQSTGGDWQLSAILSVSGVCRGWRGVAHSVKALWRFVYIGEKAFQPTLDPTQQSHFARLAKDVPLDVLVDEYDARYWESGNYDDLIYEYAEQWMERIWSMTCFISCFITCCQDKLPWASFTLGSATLLDFSFFNSIRASRLVFRHAEYSLWPSIGTGAAPPMFGTRLFEQLNELELHQLSESCIHIHGELPHLRRLLVDVRGSRHIQTEHSFPWVWKLVTRAPRLEVLEIAATGRTIGSELDDGFTHPALHTLVVNMADFAPSLLALRSMIALPALRHLALRNDFSKTERGFKEVLRSFLKFQAIAGAKIEHLEVCAPEQSRVGQDFAYIASNLGFLPHLSTLEIHGSELDEGFGVANATRLILGLSTQCGWSDLSSRSHLCCPSLSSLILNGVLFHSETLFDLVEARCATGRHFRDGTINKPLTQIIFKGYNRIWEWEASLRAQLCG